MVKLLKSRRKKTKSPKAVAVVIQETSSAARLMSVVRKAAANIGRHRKLSAGIGLGAVVAVIAFAGFQQSNSQKSGIVCTSEVLERASQQYDRSQLPGLAQTVREIRAHDGYENDINCLYVLAVYHANREDAVQAKDSLQAFKTARLSGQSLSPLALAGDYTDPAQLDVKVEYLRTLQSQAEGNVRGGDL